MPKSVTDPGPWEFYDPPPPTPTQTLGPPTDHPAYGHPTWANAAHPNDPLWEAPAWYDPIVGPSLLGQHPPAPSPGQAPATGNDPAPGHGGSHASAGSDIVRPHSAPW